MPLRIQVDTTDAQPSRFGSPDADALAGWVRDATRAALRAEAVDEAEVSVTLLGDPAITQMNRRYLDHEGATDVLAFALHGADEPPLGDVYIGHEEAWRQARRFGVAPAEELARLAVHGTLHVLGHDHPPGEERERSAMWALQERIVRQLAGDA